MRHPPHEYVARDLGHSTEVCKWCAGTPSENFVLNPHHCEARARNDTEGLRRKQVTEETKAAADVTRFIVVGMHSGPGPEAFKVEGIHDSEGKAQDEAKRLAGENEGAIYGVFQKVGTARVTRQVDWRGHH